VIGNLVGRLFGANLINLAESRNNPCNTSACLGPVDGIIKRYGNHGCLRHVGDINEVPFDSEGASLSATRLVVSGSLPLAVL
jgi:hypothetical protein